MGVEVAVIFVPAVVAMGYACYESRRLQNMKVLPDGVDILPIGELRACQTNQENDDDQDEEACHLRSLREMATLSKLISDGAMAFLHTEYYHIAMFSVVFAAIIASVVNALTAAAFIVGSVTSIASGWIGMRVAVDTNVRTAKEAISSLEAAFTTSLRAGSIMGFSLVGLGIFNLAALICVMGMFESDKVKLFEAVAGYGLGGSSIALFARVGGGIYTKAADVGADLSGKNEYGLSEDDPRNPACIADNVGDNVGDVAGMGADLFGSLAESICAALVIAASSYQPLGGVAGLADSDSGLLFPLIVASSGIIVAIATLGYVSRFCPVKDVEDVEKTLKQILTISTAFQTPVVMALAWLFLPTTFALDNFGLTTWWAAGVCILLGLWSGLVIGYVTEFYTSHNYFPVREISQTQVVSAATGIIYGLALGYLSCVIPVFCIAASVTVSHTLAGMYGVSLAALGMLGTLSLSLTIDAFGPIADNAGGLAEMAELGPHVRYRTDALDAAGNTTAAIGKGFAIGSAALVSLALFGAFTVRANVTKVDVLEPWTFSGLLIGALLPYAFSAMTMKSVGVAATDMVKECMRQFPDIIAGKMEPQYTSCIKISTDAAIKEMRWPGAIVLLSPLAMGFVMGKNATAGLLAGCLVSGVQMAISASNSGGAWDNAKKYIETGALGADCAKGSAAHKNAVTGDTVGDPLKDTSGPSLNILIKLSAIVSLVFGAQIDSWSNATGGPFWI
ncbi:MAG: uncharacterized protein KVP18_002847 [Porospora cf. gigantea A]|uniref:uncharacterized protein n=1 Tax=Porospora cf. gigantea A TaxID=2853593 RepID=UPI0035597215|nr:MAG: hypothetical protein KVP18_002847 [Porospora cf. gigantea A]